MTSIDLPNMWFVYGDVFTRIGDLEKLLETANGLHIDDDKGLGDLQAMCLKAFDESCKEGGLPLSLRDDNIGEDWGELTEEEKKAATGKGFDARGKIASAWQRAMKTKEGATSELGLKYDKVKHLPAEVKMLKQEWGAETYKNVEMKKSFGKNFSEKTKVEDDWFTFGSLVLSYGPWEWAPGRAGAKLHAIKAARLGPKWVRVDTMSKLIHYRKERLTGSREIDKSWGLLTSFYNQEGEATKIALSSAPAILPPPAPAAEDAKAKTAAETAKGNKGDKGNKGKGKNPDDKPLTALVNSPKDTAQTKLLVEKWKEAAAAKTVLNGSIGGAKGLVAKFLEDAAWDWGDSDKVRGKLEANVTKLEKNEQIRQGVLAPGGGGPEKDIWASLLARELERVHHARQGR
jgi:hypothetical protein